jgi:hypothetical protein
MADFNQSPSGQTSAAVTLTAIQPVVSTSDPVWQVPQWPQASASMAITIGGGGGSPATTLPTSGQVWPVAAS